MQQHHMQGHRGASVRLGLVHNTDLVAIMSFSRHHKYKWEIIRFASIKNLVIVGGASRLFKRFLEVCRKPPNYQSKSDLSDFCITFLSDTDSTPTFL